MFWGEARDGVLRLIYLTFAQVLGLPAANRNVEKGGVMVIVTGGGESFWVIGVREMVS